MRRRRLPSLLALAWLGWCCRGREGLHRADAAPPAAGARPETGSEPAALLLVDPSGNLKTVCLPSRREQPHVFPGIALRRILDAHASGGQLTVAALAAAAGPGRQPIGRLLLLSPGSDPRVIAEDARYARFSPAGDALLIESSKRQHVGGGSIGEISRSAVLDVATGDLRVIGGYADPRWEADGKHVRATGLRRKPGHRGARLTAQWLATRVRWDRESGTVTTVGPGSSQIPSPQGTAVAWLEEEWSSPFGERCHLSLAAGAAGQHPAAGPFCQGVADDRAIRWSPDGRYLAFASFVSRSSDPLDSEAPLFVDIVALAGGRHPGLAALLAPGGQVRGVAAARAPAGFPWLDWSPSQGHLAVQDSDQNVQIIDLDKRQVASIGKGRSPAWSPHGDYLLVRAPMQKERDESLAEAFVIPGGSIAGRISMGRVRDIRWILSVACGSGGGT